MREYTAKISAARGRIIKRGGLKLSPAIVTPMVTKTPSEGPQTLSRVSCLKNQVTIFLIVPALFCASASITWNRPLATSEVSAPAREDTLDRFQRIGDEIISRFSTNTNGAVIPKPVSQRNTSSQSVVTGPSSGTSSKAAVGGVERAALEGQVYKVLKKHGRPVQNGKALASAIVREALAQDYDPVFVAAVIKSESAFNTFARSHKGAQGLMQIMPKTGAWLAQQQALPQLKLTDPGHNLKLGISYLKQLEKEYNGNRMLTLVAYNWGPGHVQSASFGSRRVPGEVMQYAIKILNDYRRWSSELRSSLG